MHEVTEGLSVVPHPQWPRLTVVCEFQGWAWESGAVVSWMITQSPFLGGFNKLASLHCSWLENDAFFLASLFLVREWRFLSIFSYFPVFFLFRLRTLFIHSITTSASSDNLNWRVWGVDQVQNQLVPPSRVWHWRQQCIHKFNTTCHMTTALQSS